MAITYPKTRASTRTIYFGSDPEMFFVKTRRVMGRSVKTAIGAEKVLPASGLPTNSGQVIIDGVQGELNPGVATCREQAGNMIMRMLRETHKLAKLHKTELSFEPTIPISKKELNSLSEEHQKFGCTPSFNAYGESVEIPDGTQHLVRFAGGHIHLGFYNYDDEMKSVMQKDPVTIVKLLDIIVGNTMVLIDRDPGNAIRRQAYGRAGEFRTPKHGIEYRTPSNFWLKRIEYVGLVLGFARLAVEVSTRADWVKAYLSAVKEEDIRNAINNNDAELAMKNFKKIKSLLVHSTIRWIASPQGIDGLLYFISKGESHWFKETGMSHWNDNSIIGSRGWEYFLQTVVLKEMQTKKKSRV